MISYFLLTGLNNYAGFLDDQLEYSRVKTAYDKNNEVIRQKLDSFELKLTSFEVMFKAYKYEQEFFVYVRDKSQDEWKVYQKYAICSSSGDLGPKVQQGDLQVPEGYYYINHFNPYSNFLLSMGINYPNKADIKRRPASDKGGAIYIHGNCVTIGCIPLTDAVIEELYVLGVLATNSGQAKIQAHIFPFHLTEANLALALTLHPEQEAFWKNLRETERFFDSIQVQPNVLIDTNGDYYISGK